MNMIEVSFRGQDKGGDKNIILAASGKSDSIFKPVVTPEYLITYSATPSASIKSVSEHCSRTAFAA